MALQISIYKCTAENNRVDKTDYISSAFNMVGTLRGECSVLDPVIVVEKTNPAIMNYNYMYIPEFGRWYFITDIISKSNKIWEIHAHVDVLYTWGASIKANKAVISKTADAAKANIYLDDGSFVMDSHKYHTIIPFVSGFDAHGSNILICAGGH